MYLKGFAISWSSKGIKFCQKYIRILSKLVFELRQEKGMKDKNYKRIYNFDYISMPAYAHDLEKPVYFR